MNVVLDGAEGIVDGGHSPPYVTMVADFASLYPPYTWIPASAGMTRQVQQDAAGGLGVSPRYSSCPPRLGGIKEGWLFLIPIRQIRPIGLALHSGFSNIKGVLRTRVDG
jgi:hypothetical protein